MSFGPSQKLEKKFYTGNLPSERERQMWRDGTEKPKPFILAELAKLLERSTTLFQFTPAAHGTEQLVFTLDDGPNGEQRNAVYKVNVGSTLMLWGKLAEASPKASASSQLLTMENVLRQQADRQRSQWRTARDLFSPEEAYIPTTSVDVVSLPVSPEVVSEIRKLIKMAQMSKLDVLQMPSTLPFILTIQRQVPKFEWKHTFYGVDLDTDLKQQNRNTNDDRRLSAALFEAKGGLSPAEVRSLIEDVFPDFEAIHEKMSDSEERRTHLKILCQKLDRLGELANTLPDCIGANNITLCSDGPEALPKWCFIDPFPPTIRPDCMNPWAVLGAESESWKPEEVKVSGMYTFHSALFYQAMAVYFGYESELMQRPELQPEKLMALKKRLNHVVGGERWM